MVGTRSKSVKFRDFAELDHKIPKISPGAYIFQRPFLRSLSLEGLVSTEGNLCLK